VSALELMIWSMAAGVIGAVVVVGLIDVAVVRTAGAAQGVVYHLTALLQNLTVNANANAVKLFVSIPENDLEALIKPSEVGDSLEFRQLLDHSSSSILMVCGYN